MSFRVQLLTTTTEIYTDKDSVHLPEWIDKRLQKMREGKGGRGERERGERERGERERGEREKSQSMLSY